LSRKVAIITDSTAYFEPGEAEKFGIHVVPLTIQIGDDKFLEGSQVDTDDLFRRAGLVGKFPISHPPGVAVFEKLYAELHRQTDQILSIHISSHLSKTLQHARVGSVPLLGRCSISGVD
jgi:DegV family protein with EDD domain